MRKTARTASLALLLFTCAAACAAEETALLLRCKGQDATDEEAAAIRARMESGGFYGFAVRLFGNPTSCEVAWQTFDDVRFGAFAYEFGNKAKLRLESAPPETFVNELEVPGGFKEEDAAREFLENQVQQTGFEIDWNDQPEEEKTEKRVRKVWWDPVPGNNASASLSYEGKTLVAIRVSAAL